MKRLGAVEKGILLLAGVFIICGAYSVIHPTEMILFHPSGRRYRSPGPEIPELVTRGKARIYGILSIALGAGMGWLALYRPRR